MHKPEQQPVVPDRAATGTPQPVSQPVAPAHPKSLLWARIVLPSKTIPAGSMIPARVMVVNNTGGALHGEGCGSPFQVAFANDKIVPSVTWLDCLQRFTIPAGESSWPVTVAARYSACGAELVHCVERYPPALPPGDYRAMLFLSSRVVPTPPPVHVRIVP
jgi:hypothetical protein